MRPIGQPSGCLWDKNGGVLGEHQMLTYIVSKILIHRANY